MSEVLIQTLSPQTVVSAVLRAAKPKKIEDAVGCFTRIFGIRITALDWSLRTKSVDRILPETRELYPDYFLQSDQTFVSGEHVITQ